MDGSICLRSHQNRKDPACRSPRRARISQGSGVAPQSTPVSVAADEPLQSKVGVAWGRGCRLCTVCTTGAEPLGTGSRISNILRLQLHVRKADFFVWTLVCVCCDAVTLLCIVVTPGCPGPLPRKVKSPQYPGCCRITQWRVSNVVNHFCIEIFTYSFGSRSRVYIEHQVAMALHHLQARRYLASY